MKRFTLIVLIAVFFVTANVVFAESTPPVQDPPATAVWNLTVESVWGEGTHEDNPVAAGTLYLYMGYTCEHSFNLEQGLLWHYSIQDPHPFLTTMVSDLVTINPHHEVFPDGGTNYSSITTSISTGTHTHKWMDMTGSSSSD